MGQTWDHSLSLLYTLYVLKNNKCYILALTPVRRSDKMVAVAHRLVERGKTDWLEARRLYLNRRFDNNGVVACLIAVY